MRGISLRKFLRFLLPIIFLLVFFTCEDPYVKNKNKYIIVYGDSRTGHEMHQRIVNTFSSFDPVAVFHTGDLVNDGRIEENWNIFNLITSQFIPQAKFYPAIGNHEYDSQLYYNNFTLPNNERWYKVNLENIQFIMLDSVFSELTPGSKQYIWLENLLSSSTSIPSFIIFHYPLFTTGAHYQSSKTAELKLFLPQLFDKYNVKVIFNGHDHNYERSYYNGIYYIVTGGGGAPLRDQATTSEESQVFIKEYNFCRVENLNEKIKITVYNEKKDIIDYFSIIK